MNVAHSPQRIRLLVALKLCAVVFPLIALLVLQSPTAAKDKKNTENKSESTQSNFPWKTTIVISLVIGGFLIYGYLSVKEDERRAAVAAERRARLIEKYGEEIGELIADREIFEGMTSEMLIDSRGEPAKVEETYMRGKLTQQCYFGGWYNKRGTEKFNLRVTVENDLVIGWKEGQF